MTHSDNQSFYGFILAAGLGKRLRSGENDTYPKVLREIHGRPMISYVIDALRGADVENICVVVGQSAEVVKSTLGADFLYAVQANQLGSGDAAASAKDVLQGKSEHIIVMCGDSPLFTPPTVASLKEEHLRRNATITLASAVVDDPTGYGRIVRRDSEVAAIVEDKAATPEEKAIREINGGLYAFDSDWLWSNIGRIQPNEATGEYCLTDMVQFAIEDGKTVASVHVPSEEVLGVNTPEQLREAEDILKKRSITSPSGTRI